MFFTISFTLRESKGHGTTYGEQSVSIELPFDHDEPEEVQMAFAMAKGMTPGLTESALLSCFKDLLKDPAIVRARVAAEEELSNQRSAKWKAERERDKFKKEATESIEKIDVLTEQLSCLKKLAGVDAIEKEENDDDLPI